MSPNIDTRQRIVDAARELFYANSYTEVGVASICDHAGVQKGSFYHFFPSKRDLTLAVIDSFYLSTKERLLDQAFDPTLPPMARLDRLIEMSVAMQQNLKDQTGHVLGCAFGNLATELSTQDEPIRAAIAAVMHRFQRLLHETLQAAVDDGSLGNIDPAATAQAMLAYLEGVLMLAKTENDTDVIRRLLPALRDIRVPRSPQGGSDNS